MSDLVEFLLARIAEDEAAARAATIVHRKQVEYLGDGKWGREYLQPLLADEVSRSVVAYIAPGPSSPGDSWTDLPGSEHFARHDPARVLAECEAKRRIVELHAGIDPCDAHDGATMETAPCETLRTLATIYADHADYNPAWSLDNGPDLRRI